MHGGIANIRRKPWDSYLTAHLRTTSEGVRAIGAQWSGDREFTLKQALKTAAFWKLILATTTRVGVYNSITVHFVPIMVWRGASEAKAAAMLATMALMSLPSHLFVGWIADRVNKPRLMAGCMFLGAGAVTILAYGNGEWALWTFTLLSLSSKRYSQSVGQLWEIILVENILPRSAAV